MHKVAHLHVHVSLMLVNGAHGLQVIVLKSIYKNEDINTLWF